MNENPAAGDKLTLKSKKGIWRRFFKLFPKCDLPYLLVIIYAVFSLGFVELGVSETDMTAQLFAGDTSAALVTKLVIIMIFNMIASSFVVALEGFTSARITRNMRNVLLKKVLRLPMSYFKDENPRDAVYRITNNATVIDATLTFFILPMITTIYTLLRVIGKVFKHDWRLTLVMIAFVPIQIGLAILFGKISYHYSKVGSDVSSGLTQKLGALVTRIPLAKAFAQEDKETEEASHLVDRLYKANIRGSWFSKLSDSSQTIIEIVRAIIIALVGYALLSNEEITRRGWTTFFLFAGTFNSAAMDFWMYWNNLKTIQGGADVLTEIMDSPEEKLEGEKCENLVGSIELKNISFAYGEEPVLRDISCTFADNKVTALLGMSGSGKTTLMHLLTRIYEPKSGEMSVGGRSAFDYALDSYREQFVMVSQEGMLFSGTVRDNLTYGYENISDDEIIEALKNAGAYDFVSDMPKGIDSELNEYGSNLSGGQRQRLALARAFLSKAHYVILDEPIAAMDAIATADLLKRMQKLLEGKCAIVIAHSAAILSIADRAVILENGKISAEGDIESVAKTNGFMQALLEKKVTDK